MHLADGEAAQAGVGDAVGVGRLLQAVLLADLGADGLAHVPGARFMSQTSGAADKTAYNTAHNTATRADLESMPLTRQESIQHAVSHSNWWGQTIHICFACSSAPLQAEARGQVEEQARHDPIVIALHRRRIEACRLRKHEQHESCYQQSCSQVLMRLLAKAAESAHCGAHCTAMQIVSQCRTKHAHAAEVAQQAAHRVLQRVQQRLVPVSESSSDISFTGTTRMHRCW